MRITYAQAVKIAEEISGTAATARLLPLLDDEARLGHILLRFDYDSERSSVVVITPSGHIARRRFSWDKEGGSP